MIGKEHWAVLTSFFRKKEITPAEQVVRAAFFDYNRDVRIANSKVAGVLIFTLVPFGVTLDYIVYPADVGFFFILRLICGFIALVMWKLLDTALGRRHFRIIDMGWFVLPSFFISLMIYYAQGVSSSYYAGLNLVLIGVSWVARVDFMESLIATVLVMLMYGVACVAHGGGTVAEYYSNYYFIGLTGIIVITGNYFLNEIRFREFALRTELDLSRRELEESHAKLVELDKAKSNFFANISHELRTPLTLLIGPLDSLRRDAHQSHQPQQGELLDIMYNNAMRLLRLINDLLDLVRLDAGTIRVNRRKVALAPFIEGLAQSVRPIAGQRQLQFTCVVHAPDGVEVWMDRDKMEKVILNLLFNSFKFTPESGRVTLDCALEKEQLIVQVIDTGRGIGPDNLARIFDRFWQADAASTRHYQGVGIGLALVKELTEAHGGDVNVESELGKGTKITVRVDVAKHEETELVADPAIVPDTEIDPEWLTSLYRRAEYFPSHVVDNRDGSEELDENTEGKPLVLIADDEPEMRRFLTSQLKDHYAICEVKNGSEALELAREKEFTLILLDLMMPGIDGITLTRELREIPRTAAVPIVILTARTDEHSKMAALEAGATDFLTKPFASSELFVRCRNLVTSRKLQQYLEKQTKELEATLDQLKQTEAQLVHQAKMASLGQLSAGLMHEINNPLNFANTAAHIMKKRLAAVADGNREPLEKPLQDLMDGIGRVAGIVGNLRSFAHPGTGEFTVMPLADIVESAVRFVPIAAQGIELKRNIPPEHKVWGDRNQLIHLFVNLLQNSVDSVREKGEAQKEIRLESVLQNGYVCLTCWDNGKGIKASDVNKIFDAFYTTKPVGKGMGLGLNLSHRIVENHQGEIHVQSAENQYCQFTITLRSTP